MAQGAFGTYFFFTRQVSALNSRFDHFEQLLAAPLPAPVDTHAPMPQPGKKHGQNSRQAMDFTRKRLDRDEARVPQNHSLDGGLSSNTTKAPP